MIIMSIDYGDVRTGLAVCDKFEYLASPAGVITESHESKLIAQIAQKAVEVKAEMLIVGLPKNMDGSKGERAIKCEKFAKKVEEATGLETKLVDERLTTCLAHRALSETNVRGKKRKAVVDAVSAVFILESFLQSRK